jgi:hypothetical protein
VLLTYLAIVNGIGVISACHCNVVIEIAVRLLSCFAQSRVALYDLEFNFSGRCWCHKVLCMHFFSAIVLDAMRASR